MLSTIVDHKCVLCHTVQLHCVSAYFKKTVIIDMKYIFLKHETVNQKATLKCSSECSVRLESVFLSLCNCHWCAWEMFSSTQHCMLWLSLLAATSSSQPRRSPEAGAGPTNQREMPQWPKGRCCAVASREMVSV